MQGFVLQNFKKYVLILKKNYENIVRVRQQILSPAL